MSASFDSILDLHGPALARVAGLYVRSPQEKDELLQEILVAVWRALPSFRGDSSIRTFLFRVAHNRGITWSSRHRPTTELVDAEHDPRIDEAIDARRMLERAIRALPDGQRQVMVLALEDLSHAEIAEVLGITENNVAVRLVRARERIREVLGGRHG